MLAFVRELTLIKFAIGLHFSKTDFLLGLHFSKTDFLLGLHFGERLLHLGFGGLLLQLLEFTLPLLLLCLAHSPLGSYRKIYRFNSRSQSFKHRTNLLSGLLHPKLTFAIS